MFCCSRSDYVFVAKAEAVKNAKTKCPDNWFGDQKALDSFQQTGFIILDICLPQASKKEEPSRRTEVTFAKNGRQDINIAINIDNMERVFGKTFTTACREYWAAQEKKAGTKEEKQEKKERKKKKKKENKKKKSK